jgi:hypothetical protein
VENDESVCRPTIRNRSACILGRYRRFWLYLCPRIASGWITARPPFFATFEKPLCQRTRSSIVAPGLCTAFPRPATARPRSMEASMRHHGGIVRGLRVPNRNTTRPATRRTARQPSIVAVYGVRCIVPLSEPLNVPAESPLKIGSKVIRTP